MTKKNAVPSKTRVKKKKKAKKSSKSHLRHSKTDNFLESVRSNSMVEYFTRLRIMNPAAQLKASLNEPRREGSFVRLAHAREEFTAPIITKGKSVTPPLKSSQIRPASPKRKKKIRTP